MADLLYPLESDGCVIAYASHGFEGSPANICPMRSHQAGSKSGLADLVAVWPSHRGRRVPLAGSVPLNHHASTEYVHTYENHQGES